MDRMQLDAAITGPAGSCGLGDQSVALRQRRPLAEIRILCIDDDADERDSLALSLEVAGARVTRACSAADARMVLRYVSPHVLVSDLCMPVEDGFDFVKRFRSEENGRRRRVAAIAVTGLDRAEAQQRARIAGYDLLLTKPCAAADLIAAITQLVRR